MNQDWEIKDFEDCLDKLPSSKKIPRKKFLTSGKYPIISQEKTDINGYWDDPEDLLCIERPVVIFGDHTKILKYIDFDFVKGADGVKVFLPKKNINPLFFFYQLKSISLDDLGYARHYRLLKKIQIKFPSIEEQKKIVAKLDQTFAAIDTAKINVEKNLENAKELFQSKLNEIFSQKGDDWVESKLEEITIKIGSGATPRGGQSSYKESGISLIRSLNVFDDGFRKGKLAFIDETQAEKLNNVTIEIGDVLLNITGASVARCCIAPSECLPARVNQHVSIIRLKEDTMSSEFLHYLLIAKLNKDLLLGIGDQGATRQAITKKQIESFIISYPEGDKEQKQSTRLINNLKNQILSLESKYQQELNSLQELKKSILEKAFAGEL